MAKKPKSLPSDTVADVTGEPQTEVKAKTGRPSTYSDKVANDICIRIALGESLRRICMEDKMPAQSSVYEWLLRHSEFAEKYTRARELQAETQFDELTDIVDQHPDLAHVVGKDGELIEVKFDSSYVAWMKLRVDTRKWTAARMAPKKYAEYRQPEEKVDAMIVDGEIKNVMDVAIKRLELIRIAE